MLYSVTIRETHQIVADKVILAKSFMSRLKGLMGHPGLDRGEGMLLSPCNSIHTFFMRFPIDVVFLSRDNEIIESVHSMLPWRLSSIHWKAASVLELPGGSLEDIDVVKGQHLDFNLNNDSPENSTGTSNVQNSNHIR